MYFAFMIAVRLRCKMATVFYRPSKPRTIYRDHANSSRVKGDQYVSKCSELEVASCGDTVENDGLEAVFSKKLVTAFEVTV